MDKTKKILLAAFVVLAGFAGFNFFEKNAADKLKEQAVKPDANDAAKQNLSAALACPEFFTQSAENYLASASQNQNNEKCFITGCGGAF